MKTKTHSHAFLQKRKFFLVLPLLALPFITLMFWALGGGKISSAKAQQTAKQGLNPQLPDAFIKEDKLLDKLSYYEKAASDSARLQELMKHDPYYTRQRSENREGLFAGNDSAILPSATYKPIISNGNNNLNTSLYGNHSYTDPNEAKVYKKLDELNTALNQAAVLPHKAASNLNSSSNSGTALNSADLDRLEQMMESTHQGTGSGDPEIKQLDQMMEKVLDIQHPERVKEKLRQTSATKKEQVFAVSANSSQDSVSFLDNGLYNRMSDAKMMLYQNGFYSLDDAKVVNEAPNAVPAVVHEIQTLVNGSTVKLRLVSDIFINGMLIPKDNFLFGIATLNGERLNIKIKSIRYRNALFPVDLSVYDMDGVEGIYIPGAVSRDVAKESAGRSLQDIGITSFNPSIGAQAATAGLEAVKTLFSKKVKLIKATVKAGYQVLLYDEKQKQSN
jgi:conjugative transposon TraM protein